MEPQGRPWKAVWAFMEQAELACWRVIENLMRLDFCILPCVLGNSYITMSLCAATMGDVQRAKYRFSNIILENWRNFTRAEVRLRRRVFMVGPNASGKSNFLDVFRFLHDVCSEGGGLQSAVGQRGGVSSIRSLAARRHPDIMVEVAIGNVDAPDAWGYRVKFSQDIRQRVVINEEVVTRNGSQILIRPNADDRDDPERLTQTFLEQVNMNKEFREIAEFFGSVHYLHLVPQLVRDPDRSIGRKNDPFGGDFLALLASTPEQTRNARLRRITEALKVAIPQLQELKLTRDSRGIPHIQGKYEHWRPQGARQSEGQLSDGTLRMLGLLWSIQDGSGPLLLEEPELSLHPEVVRYIPQMFYRAQRRSGRQIIMSTHSPEMLRDDGIGLDEVLLLIPGKEGTSIRVAAGLEDVEQLLAHGSSLADIVMPKTRPKDAAQLTLLDFGGQSG